MRASECTGGGHGLGIACVHVRVVGKHVARRIGTCSDAGFDRAARIGHRDGCIVHRCHIDGDGSTRRIQHAVGDDITERRLAIEIRTGREGNRAVGIEHGRAANAAGDAGNAGGVDVVGQQAGGRKSDGRIFGGLQCVGVGDGRHEYADLASGGADARGLDVIEIDQIVGPVGPALDEDEGVCDACERSRKGHCGAHCAKAIGLQVLYGRRDISGCSQRNGGGKGIGIVERHDSVDDVVRRNGRCGVQLQDRVGTVRARCIGRDGRGGVADSIGYSRR